MRQAGTIPGEVEAQPFLDHLLTLGIEGEAEQSAEGTAIWIYDEKRLEEAREELRAFLEDPGAARFHADARKANALRREEARREKRRRRQTVQVRGRWGGGWSRSPVTWSLIGLSILVAIASHLGRQEEVTDYLRITSVRFEEHRMLWLAGLQEIRHGQVWRLFTPVFLHFTPLHLLFNMYWLYALGQAIETLRGSWRLLAATAVLAVLANLGQYTLGGHPNFGGMSGVVYGYFGFVWMRSRFEPLSGFFMPRSTAAIMLFWLALCMTGAVGPIGNAAHLTGLVAGMALGLLPRARRYLEQRLPGR